MSEQETYAIEAEIALLTPDDKPHGEDSKADAWQMGARYALAWVMNLRGAAVPPSLGLVMVRQIWPEPAAETKPEGTE